MAQSLQLRITAIEAFLASRRQVIRVFATVEEASADAEVPRSGKILRIITGVARGLDKPIGEFPRPEVSAAYATLVPAAASKQLLVGR